jgi:hypothetical protein
VISFIVESKEGAVKFGDKPVVIKVFTTGPAYDPTVKTTGLSTTLQTGCGNIWHL